MKIRAMAAFAGLGGAMIASGEAEGAYIGVGTKLHTTVTINDVARDVWRVYAVFDNPDDILTAIGGSVANGPGTIKSLTVGGGAGANFFNAGGGNTAPMTSSGVFLGGANAQWDTFATIGVDHNNVKNAGDDLTGVSPGFAAFIPGNQWGPTNSAWFIPGGNPQGFAVNGLNSTFYAGTQGFITGLGVLMAQLTVNAGQHAAGTVFVNGVLGGALAGTTFTATGQTFSTVPVPGALAVVVVAGLMGGRRRREEWNHAPRMNTDKHG